MPILAKILEKLVASQLSIYFEQFQLLSQYQGAYRTGRSAEQILSFAMDSITQALDAGQVVCTAFFDLRKAVDLLDHVILLKWLYALGVLDIGLQIVYPIIYSGFNTKTQCHLGSEWYPTG